MKIVSKLYILKIILVLLTASVLAIVGCATDNKEIILSAMIVYLDGFASAIGCMTGWTLAKENKDE